MKKASAKKTARRPLVRKVEAAHRLREGKQKKARLKPHVEEDAIPPHIYKPGTPPPCLSESMNKAVQETGEALGHSLYMDFDRAKGWEGFREASTPFRDDNSIVPRAYKERYGKAGNCGDMIAFILASRPQKELEAFVYQKTGKAWPDLNKGQRRMNAGNVIRAMVRGLDTETMAWLLATRPA